MASAARVCADSGLQLRVVPLPVGTDPGELIAQEGADALRERIAASVPYVVFQVERVLANRERLDAVLGEASEHWKVEQMAKVDRTILRIAVSSSVSVR